MLLLNVNDSGCPGPPSPGGDRVSAVPARAPLAATRRTALCGALLGLGGVAGCDLDRPARSPAGRGSGSATDPDVDLVDEVRTELARLSELVSEVAARYPRLQSPMQDLRALHAAHLEALDTAPGAPAGFAGQLTSAATALTLVRAQETRAQNRLADWSVRAESGALARLLASMSAAVAQQLVGLSAVAAARSTSPTGGEG